MAKTTSKTSRPLLITLISLILFYLGLGAFLSFYFVKNLIQHFGLVGIPFTIFTGIVYLVCGFGLWRLKKWSVYAFTVCEIVSQVFLLVIGHWNVVTVVLPVIVLIIGFWYLSSMT